MDVRTAGTVKSTWKQPSVGEFQRSAGFRTQECFGSSGAVLACSSAPSARQLALVLRPRPFPHYAPALGANRPLLRIDENGTRTVFRFVRRTLVPVNAPRDKDRDAA